MVTTIAQRYGFVQPLGQMRPTGADMLAWHRRLLGASVDERKHQWQCLTAGIVLQLGVSLLLVGTMRLAARWHGLMHLDDQTIATRVSMKIGLMSAAIMCGVTMLIAWFTKPEGRAERAREC